MRRIELISILINTLDGVVKTGLFRPKFIVMRIDGEVPERVHDCRVVDDVASIGRYMQK
jgi:hypothetical protein